MRLGRLVRAMAVLMLGVAAGVGLGYLIGLLVRHFEGAGSPAELQARALALRDKPLELAGEVQARFQLAMQEGRLAAAETRAALEAELPRRAGGPDRPPDPSRLAAQPDEP